MWNSFVLFNENITMLKVIKKIDTELFPLISGSERGLSVIREWPFFGSVKREKRKI